LDLRRTARWGYDPIVRHPYFDLPLPIIVGHRGSSGEAPENTLPAFERALEHGAAILETDVHVTRDGVVVVYHDAEIDRTTDGRGPIAELTFAELRALDAGYAFTPDGGRSHPFRGRGLQISTLEEIFTALPGARFNIELKSPAPGLLEGTLAALRAADREDRTLLAAADDATMARLRARLAETGLAPAVGASTGDVVAWVMAERDGKPPPLDAMVLQIPTHFGREPLVTPELLDLAHRHDTQIHVWTINEPAEMHRLLDLGVDAIMTDFPGVLRDVVEARAGRS